MIAVSILKPIFVVYLYASEGVIATQVSASTTEYLMLVLALPPMAYSGVFDVNISNANPSQLYPLQTGHFNVTILPARPAIALVNPSSSPNQGGTTVTIHVTGFPAKLSSSGVVVYFGISAALILGVPVSDGTGGSVLSVSTPAGQGLSQIVVGYWLPDLGPLPATQLNASQPFLYVSSEVTALCEVPCWCDVALLAPQNVSFVVSAANTIALNLSSFVLGCNAQLDGRPPGHGSDCSVSGFTAEPAPCDTSAGSNSKCTRVIVQILLVPRAPQLAAGPSNPGFITLESSISAAARPHPVQVSVPVSFRRSPRLLSAIFSSSFGRVSLTFDQETNTPQLPCAALLKVHGLLLGAEPMCGWSSPATLTIVLGFGATLLPGDIVTVISSLSDNKAQLVPATNQTSVVASPPVPLLPSVAITGPDSVSACDIAQLSASVSTAPGATYVWGCENDRDLDSELSNQTAGPTVTIKGTQLMAGKSYFISVQARSRFGTLSNLAFRTLVLSDSPQPLVSIKLPPPPYLRSSTIFLEAEAVFSSCLSPSAGSSITFFWTVAATGADGTQGLPVVQGAGSLLSIPAGVLAAGAQYMATLTGLQAGQSPAKTTQAFQLGTQPVVALISGGNTRSVYVQGSSLLDASPSYDPDTCVYADNGATGMPTCVSPAAAGVLVFAWACLLAGVPCSLASDGKTASFGTGATAFLDMTVLAFPSPSTSELVMTVTVSQANGGDATQASVTVLISNTPTVDVQIVPLYETAERAGYTAAIPVAEIGSATYCWSLVAGLNSAKQSFLMSDSSTFLAGNTGASFVVLLESSNAAALLSAPGAAYTVSLTVTTASGSGQASLPLFVPSPPSGGSCVAQPSVGKPILTAFTVFCLDWSADSLPITYSFAAPPSGAIVPTDTSWSTQTPAPTCEMFLPAGNYSLAAMVFDAFGASATIIAANPVVVTAGGTGGAIGAEIDLTSLGSLADRLVGQGSTGVALALFDSVAASLNAASLTVQVGSRRLSGSSAAYQMAVRRLLLQRLSGTGPVVALTAPPMIRASRRAAAAPAEIDSPGVSIVVGQLVASLNTMSLRQVRASTTFQDSVGLIGNALAAGGPLLNDKELGNLVTETSAAILAAAQLYASGMVLTEAIKTVTSTNMLLEMAPNGPAAAGLSISIASPLTGNGASYSQRRSAQEEATATPVGIAVLRLATSVGFPTAEENGVDTAAAEIVGIRMATDATLSATTVAAAASAGSWACPVREDSDSVRTTAASVSALCTRFEMTMRWAAGEAMGATAQYSCQRWDEKAWANNSCSMTDVGNGSVVNCSCDSDGIFTVAVTIAPKIVVMQAPIVASMFFRSVDSYATVMCWSLCMCLAAAVGLLFSLVSYRLGESGKGQELQCGLPAKFKDGFLRDNDIASSLGYAPKYNCFVQSAEVNSVLDWATPPSKAKEELTRAVEQKEGCNPVEHSTGSSHTDSEVEHPQQLPQLLRNRDIATVSWDQGLDEINLLHELDRDVASAVNNQVLISAELCFPSLEQAPSLSQPYSHAPLLQPRQDRSSLQVGRGVELPARPGRQVWEVPTNPESAHNPDGVNHPCPDSDLEVGAVELLVQDRARLDELWLECVMTLSSLGTPRRAAFSTSQDSGELHRSMAETSDSWSQPGIWTQRKGPGHPSTPSSTNKLPADPNSSVSSALGRQGIQSRFPSPPPSTPVDTAEQFYSSGSNSPTYTDFPTSLDCSVGPRACPSLQDSEDADQHDGLDAGHSKLESRGLQIQSYPPPPSELCGRSGQAYQLEVLDCTEWQLASSASDMLHMEEGATDGRLAEQAVADLGVLHIGVASSPVESGLWRC